MVFPVVRHGCEGWTIKKAEWWRIDAFELWCWRRLLRVPWTARDCSIQPVHPKGNQPWRCWSWNSSILATWCEKLIHLKRPWCWERLKARGEGDDRGWDGWMASPTHWAYSNSCPESQWCYPTISSSVIHFSSCLQSFPASGSFPMSQFFASGDQSIGVSATSSVLPVNIQE